MPFLDEPPWQAVRFDDESVAGVPIRRYLQDGRAAEAAMREQDVLSKDDAAAPHICIKRHTAQFAKRSAFVAAKRERHESRPNLRHAQAELPRDVVAEGRRANFRDREAARCDDKRGALQFTGVRRNDKQSVFFDTHNHATHANLDAGHVTLFQ